MRMRTPFALLAICLSAFAQGGGKVDLGKLTMECMKVDLDIKNQTSSSALWVTGQLVEAILGNAGAMPSGADKERIEKIMAAARASNIFLVTVKTRSANTVWNQATGWKSPTEGELKSRATLVLPNGNTLSPLQHLSPELIALVGVLQRSFDTKGGSQFQPIVFSNVGPSGKPILDATQKQRVQLSIRGIDGKPDASIVWRTPFDALSQVRKCEKCNDQVSAAWTYCPWDGTLIK